MSPSRIVPVLALALLSGGVCLAQDKLTGEKIVRRTEGDHKSKDEHGKIQMVVIGKNKKKKPQKRNLETLFKAGKDHDDKHVIRFLKPAKVRNLALLTVESKSRSDDQWVYMPAFRKTKKIASSNRTARFAGTDFTYEDLGSEKYKNFEYKRLADAKVEKQACYVVKATPRKDTVSGYSKRLFYVSKDKFLTLKIEFFDQKGRHQKTLLNRNFEQVQKHWRPKHSMMKDLLRGSKTVWRFKSRKINSGLSNSKFTVKSLERGA